MTDESNRNGGEERILRTFLDIASGERHFNELQSHYRRLASLWLLAVFSASGFVLTTEFQMLIDRNLLLMLIFFSGFVGIMLLWSMDLLVYHRLLDSYFLEGLVLERQHTWLPPIRHNMVASQQGVGVLVRVVRFYTFPTSVLVLSLSWAFGAWIAEPSVFQSTLALARLDSAIDSLVGGQWGGVDVGRTVLCAVFGALVFLAVGWLNSYMYRRTLASENFFTRRLSPLEPPPGYQ